MIRSIPRFVVVVSAVLGACGGDDDKNDVTADADADDIAADTASDCGGCATGKLCCPSRFEGDVPRCVDPLLNPENCGDCGTFCEGACSGGSCIAAPECAAGGSCPDELVCSAEGGGTGRCCPAGTTFIRSPADFFGCCPDGDICGCREGMCPISRRAVKTDIHYLGPDELAALGRELLATRLATYEYRRGSGRRQLGFVIDDGVPASGIAEDGSHVDLYGYVSLAVATLQVQVRELEALRAEVEALRSEVERRSVDDECRARE